MGTLKAGFTLVELLATIAVIAILIALLMPVLAGSKGAARKLGCLATQQQMAYGFNSLMEDEKRVIPYIIKPGAKLRWDTKLLEHMGLEPNNSEPVLACPTAVNHYSGVSASLGRTTYGINTRWTTNGPVGGNEGKNFDNITSASTYPLFSDTDAFTAVKPNLIYDKIGMRWALSPSPDWQMGFFHANETCNVAWADGHAKQVERSFLAGEVDGLGVPRVFFIDGAQRSLIALTASPPLMPAQARSELW